MAIQGFTGVGSGLDINNIVKAMVNAESAPKTAQLNRLERDTTAKFSGLGQFRSAISDFQIAIKDLNDPALFEKRSATSAKQDIFTAKADGTATAGNFSVQVFNLAQTSKLSLQGLDNATDPVGTGTLTISVGGEALDISIGEDASSLSGIRDAINAAGKDSGLSATIVSDPSGAGGARLVLSSDKAGNGNDISVSSSSLTGNLGQLDFTPPDPTLTDYEPAAYDPADPRAARVISYARDANLAIDGIPLSSASNTVEDAIAGVTLTLKSAQSAEDLQNAATISLGVAEDRAGVKGSLKKFVEAYNKMIGTVGSLTKVTSVGGDDGEPLAAALVGDASVRSFSSAIRNELGSTQGGTNSLRLLADLGISTQRDGTLKIDDQRMDTVLEENFEELSGFLTGDSGILSRLESKTDPYVQSGGILESRTKALQNTLSSVDDQREQLTRRIDKLEARLFSQFNAMDALVAQLSGTSDYLSGALSNLPGVVRQDKR
ncbi:flagellar filament capping protein FliD [Halopseudomonas sp.]|uniref:flagellar filament capping protein FliD n=1 Tax=Halopseudomonas sp. TaxID=2901191 RepID=UPI003001EA04